MEAEAVKIYRVWNRVVDFYVAVDERLPGIVRDVTKADFAWLIGADFNALDNLCKEKRWSIEEKPDLKAFPEDSMGNEEKVNHPKHYNQHPSGIECIDIVRHFCFNLGNAIKYIWRAGLKGNEADITDLEKALWYLQDEIAMRKEVKKNA